jgi:ParB family transcriptional regulator, chromosome partitioning protein
MADDPKPRLGRGLAALLGDAADEFTSSAGPAAPPRRAPIERLRANSKNPRKNFDEESLEELAQSIRDRGVLQPIIVRAVNGRADSYEIVAGERRWRAAQRAGLHEVPIVKIEATDRQALEIAIIENVQRADLNALEEAEGYQKLIDEFSYSHQDLGKAIGKSRSYVTNALRLLKLPEEARKLLASGQISAGHARALLAMRDPDAVALAIVEQGLSVRDVELLAANSAAPGRARSRETSRESKDPVTASVEKGLSDSLGMSVSLKAEGESGELRIKFQTLDQLELLCHKLT